MIEASLHAYFLATRGTGDARQWLRLCRIDSRPATGACLGGWLTRHWATIVTFRRYRAKLSAGILPAGGWISQGELLGSGAISPANSQPVIVYSAVRGASLKAAADVYPSMRQLSAENSTRIELVVPADEAMLRLDQFLAKRLPEFSRSRLQQLIRDGFVQLNNSNVRPRQIVRAGDKIELTEPPLEKIETLPEPIPLEILFEDEDLLVINKPAGLVVHPGAGHREHTLVNALLNHCATLSGIGGKERPGIVHRLDKETSGALVVAKNDATHRGLSKQFADRTVEKIYLALATGKLRKPAGVIEENIARHPVHRQRMSATAPRGRTAKTEYRVVRSSNRGSLLECRLHSGRTHQIRVHLHHLGHPVLGDKVYAPRRAKDFPRQMLHAWKLGFCHPRTEEWKIFEAPLPDDFAAAIKLTIESQQV
jgi:23S rRNA pseudouridine1911/1915/1917 synthase